MVAKRPILVFINSVERGHMLHDMIAPLLAKRGIAVGIYTSRLHAQERADNLSQFKVRLLSSFSFSVCFLSYKKKTKQNKTKQNKIDG